MFRNHIAKHCSNLCRVERSRRHIRRKRLLHRCVLNLCPDRVREAFQGIDRIVSELCQTMHIAPLLRQHTRAIRIAKKRHWRTCSNQDQTLYIFKHLHRLRYGKRHSVHWHAPGPALQTGVRALREDACSGFLGNRPSQSQSAFLDAITGQQEHCAITFFKEAHSLSHRFIRRFGPWGDRLHGLWTITLIPRRVTWQNQGGNLPRRRRGDMNRLSPIFSHHFGIRRGLYPM